MNTVLKKLASTVAPLAFFACGSADQADLTTFTDSASYAIGMSLGSSVVQTGADVDLDALFRGLSHVVNDRESQLTDVEMMQVLREFEMRIQQAQADDRAAMVETNTAESAAFLAENKNKAGIVTTESGLQYEVITQGDGPRPEASDRVTVHYKGTLIDGTVFEDSRRIGNPATFGVSDVISGWTEALQLMNVGSTYRVFIPAELAYGEAGRAPSIGPNAALIFEIELLAIEE